MTDTEWSERIDQAIREYPEVGEYLGAIRGNIEALAARLAAVEKLHQQWGQTLDQNLCPSCSIANGCDHTEGYQHAWDELGKAVRGD